MSNSRIRRFSALKKESLSKRWIYIVSKNAVGFIDLEEDGRLKQAAPYFRFLEGKTLNEFKNWAITNKCKFDIYEEV